MAVFWKRAAYLFNIGHYVNESRHHKHSLYLVANSDMPGFTDRERMGIANLCRYHRKSMPQPTHPNFRRWTRDAQRRGACWPRCCASPWRWIKARSRKWSGVEVSIQDRSGGASPGFGSATPISNNGMPRQAADVFREVYGKQLVIRAKR